MSEEASTSWPEIFTSAVSKSSSADIDTCWWYNIIIRVVFGGFLVCFGLIGNVLTMVIMGRERHKSSTMRMLFYLAIVDSLILLLYGSRVIIVPVLDHLGMTTAARNVQAVSIATLTYVGQTLNQISVLFTTIVTWQRYVSVCIPLKAKRYTSPRATTAMIIASLVFSVTFYLPNFFMRQLVTKPNGAVIIVTADLALSSSYQVFYSVVLHYLLSYVLPISALVFMGISLAQSLRKTKMQKENISKATRVHEEITLSLIVVVIIFVICQSIGPCRRILMLIFTPYRLALQCGGSLFFFGPWILLSLIINSTVNFIIYVLCARGFRRKVRCLLCGLNQVGPEFAQSQGTSLDRSRTTTLHI